MTMPRVSPSPTRRRWMVWSLLLVLALSTVTWFDDRDTPAEAGSAKRTKRAPKGPPASRQNADASVEDLAQALERLELPSVPKTGKADPESSASSAAAPPMASPIDLLAARSWYVAPRPPPPEVPKAPPLPFKVLGRIIEGDAPAVFLTNQNRNLIAREGMSLDNTYLVERIENNRMTLIYLPLAERQYLSLGAVN